MASIDYTQLYKLQDGVLDCVFKVEKEFYLTGGTCLSRFYHGKRYSDDLDFFTNSSSRFHFAIKNIKTEISSMFPLNITLESKDFVRFMVDGILQVDFVNDRVVRYKDVHQSEKGYLIDHIENILSNKITAVLGRDNPKDVFDIFLISNFHTFHWADILLSAKEKAMFNHEDLVVRLKSFPLKMLHKIKLIDTSFLDSFPEKYEQIIKEIKDKTQHEKMV